MEILKEEEEKEKMTEEEIKQIKEWCMEHQVSFFPMGIGFRIFKILPDSKTKKDRFLSFVYNPAGEKWFVSVWVNQSERKMVKLYMEKSAGKSPMEAIEIGWTVIENV